MGEALENSPHRIILSIPGVKAVIGSYIVKAYLTHDSEATRRCRNTLELFPSFFRVAESQ
jgi:hypothetical protein